MRIGVGMVYVLVYLIVVSLKKNNLCLFWMLLYSFIASNVIPDILNARYFVIPCALVLLFVKKNEKVKEVVNDGKNIDNIHSDI